MMCDLNQFTNKKGIRENKTQFEQKGVKHRLINQLNKELIGKTKTNRIHCAKHTSHQIVHSAF